MMNSCAAHQQTRACGQQQESLGIAADRAQEPIAGLGIGIGVGIAAHVNCSLAVLMSFVICRTVLVGSNSVSATERP